MNSGEVHPQVHASHPRANRSQPGHLDGAPAERTAKLRSRLDGLLRFGVSIEAVRQARPVDPPPDTNVLLEAEATAEASSRDAHSFRPPEATSDPSHSQPQELLAHVEDDSRRRGADECVVCGTRTVKHEDVIGRACSASLNRPVRVRMLWRCGEGHPRGWPLPDYVPLCCSNVA